MFEPHTQTLVSKHLGPKEGAQRTLPACYWVSLPAVPHRKEPGHRQASDQRLCRAQAPPGTGSSHLSVSPHSCQPPSPSPSPHQA